MKRSIVKKLMALAIATSIFAGTSVTSLAYSPLYKPPKMPSIPNITVTLPDSVKQSVDETVKQQVENINLLDTPEITENRYIHSNVFYSPSRLQVRWNPVTDATSYEICITKTDGTSHTYTSNYASLLIEKDEFITGCPRGATVKVRALNDEHYSLWCAEDTVACNSIAPH